MSEGAARKNMFCCKQPNFREASNAYIGERKQQTFLLFLDTKKAFDSVDHNFIFAVLEKINRPSWFLETMRGLMNEVVVFPSIARSISPEHGIRIERGVKQGCPLSPLIFALCYDALLEKLETGGIGNFYAFADDLAISDPQFPPASCSRDTPIAFPTPLLFL